MAGYEFLNKVNSPGDLKKLTLQQLRRYCLELRHFLIYSVSHTGGHLASNLGVVELTVALHKVFDSPIDQIIWDVGHQSYPHKIITGRRGKMPFLRQEGGISGFPKGEESPHDAFLCGHATTSVSIACGIAKAKRRLGEQGSAIAVIGDGAFTGGMAFEGLNNVTTGDDNLIVILNDNKMSISKNVGSLTTYLSKLRSNRSYFRCKDATKSALHAIPVVGDGAVEMISRSKSYLKQFLYNSSFFEDLGFFYMGPVDGHNLTALCTVLERAKSMKRPVFIHVETTKGKGYALAESNPGAYHGVGNFDPQTGNGEDCAVTGFSAAFGRHLTRLAKQDERICAVTAAMKYATGLQLFSRSFGPENRFFDVGIAEQHAVTFSAALAAKGLLPVFAVYSSFLQRAYDQLLHDCSIEKRHVVLAVDRAGLVGADGETHQGIFDCAFLTGIPGTVIYAPTTYKELQACMDRALYEENGLCAVRYPRGEEPVLEARFMPGDGKVENYSHKPAAGDCDSLLLVTYGREYAQVCGAAALLEREGIPCSVLKLNRVWPLDENALAIAGRYKTLLFAEEGYRFGGIGEHFTAALMQRGYGGSSRVQAIEQHVPQATVERQLELTGLDSQSIVTAVGELNGREVSGK